MGIVRDVTVDQLTQAVGNIDTSTLAQDSTLQNVVTAIGNISGGNDPVTNTTVNSLCKDTTGQSIASAISGLGQTLGSDRALIDGSNIGDKATFRENIGVDYVDISSQIGVFNNRITVNVLKAYKYSNGKIEIYVKGNIATNLSSGQTTIMTLPLSLTYGFDTFSGTASLNSNIITVATAGTSATAYIDLKHSGASSGDRFSFFISWFI